MTNVIEIRAEDETEARTALDALCLEGARQMLHSALQAEVADYLERHRDVRGTTGTPWSPATARLARAR